MLSNIFLLALVSTPVYASFPTSYYYDETSNECATIGNFMAPYSGIRIWCEKDLFDASKDRLAMSVCQNGFTYDYTKSDKPGCTDFSDAMEFTNTSSDMYYDPWHFGDGKFKVARRQKALDRETPVYWPDTFVGGVFKCPLDEPCTNENAIPIAPLLADEPWHFLRKFSMWTVTAKFPIMYSPDFTGHHYPHLKGNNDWAQYLDINERYRAQRENTAQVSPSPPQVNPPTPKYAPERNVPLDMTDSQPLPLQPDALPGQEKYHVPGHSITVEIRGLREGVKNRLEQKYSQIYSQYSDALKQYSPSHGMLGLLYHLRVNLEYSTAKRIWLDLVKLL
ncbi:hypothetical protein CJU90_3738 [Yarrowia sp. C11]|nr:hypothetical protein CKK34_5348 [Yarrowia sp. E02]KAG5367442.1 hypothetical protein CJU90_3738 [Yarrowia sp. C11]